MLLYDNPGIDWRPGTVVVAADGEGGVGVVVVVVVVALGDGVPNPMLRMDCIN